MSLHPCHSLPQVKGVDQSNGVYAALAGIMLLACIAFGVTWAACMALGVADTVRQRRLRKLVAQANKAQLEQAAIEGRDVADDDDLEVLDRTVSRRGTVDHPGAAGGVRDVLNPLQRARKMLGSGTSSRYLGQSPLADKEDARCWKGASGCAGSSGGASGSDGLGSEGSNIVRGTASAGAPR